MRTTRSLDLSQRRTTCGIGEKQTGEALDTKGFDVPDISTVGVYDVSVKLHPKVTGSFKVDVQKNKSRALSHVLDFWLATDGLQASFRLLR